MQQNKHKTIAVTSKVKEYDTKKFENILIF